MVGDEKPAISYLRVSTQAQKTEGTIDAQRQAIIQYAKKEDYKIVREFLDEGVSGATVERPGLDMLRGYFREGGIKDLIIKDMDRLGRLDEGATATDIVLLVEREAERYGVNIHYVEFQKTGNPVTDMLVRETKKLFSGIERLTIKERSRWGKIAKAKKGSTMLNGYCVPLGYNLTAKDSEGCSNLSINPKQAETVRKIFDLYTKRHESSLSIAIYLTKHKVSRKRGGTTWGNSDVLRILRNKTYIGQFVQNKNKHVLISDSGGVKRYKKIPKEKTDWITSSVPAIIDRPVFDLAQRKLDQNSNQRFSKRNSVSVYPYSSILKCGVCGASYHVRVDRRTKGKVRIFYKCASQIASKHPFFLDKPKCDNHSVRQEVLDNSVWKYIATNMLNDTFWQSLIPSKDKDPGELKEATLTKIKRLEEELYAVEKMEGRLLDEYLGNRFSQKILDTKLADIRKKVVDIKGKISSEEKTFDVYSKAYLSKHMLAGVRHDLLRDKGQKELLNPTDIVKQEILRSTVKEITVNKAGFIIDGAIRVPVLQGSTNGSESNLVTTMSLNSFTGGRVVFSDQLVVPFYVEVSR